MNPCAPAKNGADGRVGDAKSLSNGAMCKPISPQLSNFANAVNRQAGQVLPLSSSATPTSFPRSVGYVVDVRAEKQMGRIDTNHIVAAMQYACPAMITAWHAWDLAVRQYPCHAVRTNDATSKSNTAVTVIRSRSEPEPATVWPITIDLIPKALRKLLWRGTSSRPPRHISQFNSNEVVSL